MMVDNDVIREIRDPMQRWSFVVDFRTRERIDPLEIYIWPLHCWVRADGRSVRYDSTRGFLNITPNWFDRWRIRRAFRFAARNF